MSADFRSQLTAAYEKKVLGTLDKAVRRTAIKVFTRVVLDTPVDTGRARANWNIDLNTVNVRLVDPTGIETDKDYDGIEKTLTVAKEYKITDTVFISNNLPYIRRLDEGHSKQAPAGFVDAAIQVGVRQSEELIKEP